MHELIVGELLAASDVMSAQELEDAALLADGRLALSTDSFTVQPLFFPGGDIGKLAVTGTVNDLAMRGARARWLSVGMIIEEGLGLPVLRQVVASIRAACDADGVHVVTGDTKVVGRGAADRLFVNTTGVGEVFAEPSPSVGSARPGDSVLISGTIGDHGIAVLAAREELSLTGPVESDCASLLGMVEHMMAAGSEHIRCLRDPTRGGVAAALNEIAAASDVAIEIEEAAVPVSPHVQGACELLGMTPFEVANEGKLVAVVADQAAERVLAAMQEHPVGARAAMVGRVTDGPGGRVSVRTLLGTSRLLDLPAGELLPRIC
jgi:hydrogenase expression/formation protein HypE